MSFLDLVVEVLESDLCARCGGCVAVCPSKLLRLAADSSPVFQDTARNQPVKLQRPSWIHDVTNTYFEGEAPGQPKAQRGHSKDKRTDCPLLTLALVLDASGFVRRSKVFAGNVREHYTVADRLEALDAPRAFIASPRSVPTRNAASWSASRPR